jgi:hypothetical protein
MKAVVIILSILVILACLAFGFYLGNSTAPPISTPTPSQILTLPPTGQGSPVSQTPSSSQATTLPSNPKQHNLVFIQADDLTNVNPHLESIWLVGYLPGSARVTVILVYPAPPGTSSPKAAALGTTFSVTHEGKPGEAFIAAVRSYGFPVNGYFLSDNQGTAKLVDFLGGIDMGDTQGVLQSGPAVLTRLTPPWQDLPASRISQQKLTEGICARLNQVTTETNWLPLVMGLMPDHLNTDLSLELASTDWKQLTSGPEKLSCRVAVP